MIEVIILKLVSISNSFLCHFCMHSTQPMHWVRPAHTKSLDAQYLVDGTKTDLVQHATTGLMNLLDHSNLA